jgi:hypothetical protein
VKNLSQNFSAFIITWSNSHINSFIREFISYLFSFSGEARLIK